jgi:hypothetical protein
MAAPSLTASRAAGPQNPHRSRKRTHPIVCIVVGATLLLGAVPASRPSELEHAVVGEATPQRAERRLGETIGSIDFYGLRTVTPQQLREALHLKEGDPVPGTDAEVVTAVRRLEKVPGVVRARLERVCCDEQGRVLLFVGIEERGAPRFQYRPAPTGVASLPPETVRMYQRYEMALAEAAEKGEATEDVSQGHSLATNASVRRFEEQFLALAASQLKLLRRVLHHSGKAEQRQIAACLIGYAANKRAVVADLLSVVSDPDEGVRNNAARALMAIATLAERQPRLGIHIDPAPLIAMLNSIVWTDRNKAAAVLMPLTSSRSTQVLVPLRQRALPALVEMARWKSPGHAQAPFFVVGRIAGLDDKAIWQAWVSGEREPVIARALQSARAGGSR